MILTMNKKSVFSWCLYDWANSVFSAVIITFVFAIYFKDGIVGDQVKGAALWGYMMGASGFVIAILAPVMGSMADNYGKRKPWTFVFSMICIVSTATLWFATPDKSDSTILWTLIAVGVANVAFEMGIVFNNAMLPDIVSKEKMGRVSGWAWGAGYIGGIICLLIILLGFIGLGEGGGFLGLPKEDAVHVRASTLFVAVWFLIFMIPLFIWTKDHKATGLSAEEAETAGLKQLWQTIKSLKSKPDILKFLIASMIYRDGLITLFAVGAVYAGAVYGMQTADVIQFGIGMNVTAGLGALAFAWFDDKWGSKRAIIISLVGLLIAGAGVLWAPDKETFMVLALVLGLFVGPVQSASRTMMGHIAPDEQKACFYGLYALSGKSVSFMGPMFYSSILLATGIQQLAMSTILVFWLIGLLILLSVKEQKS